MVRVVVQRCFEFISVSLFSEELLQHRAPREGVNSSPGWDKYLRPDGSWSVNINLENTVAETVLPGQPLLRRWVSGMRQVIQQQRFAQAGCTENSGGGAKVLVGWALVAGASIGGVRCLNKLSITYLTRID